MCGAVFFSIGPGVMLKEKKKVGKRGRTVLIHLFWGPDPKKFNLLASSHHCISIRQADSVLFDAEAAVAALCLFGVTVLID